MGFFPLTSESPIFRIMLAPEDTGATLTKLPQNYSMSFITLSPVFQFPNDFRELRSCTVGRSSVDQH